MDSSPQADIIQAHLAHLAHDLANLPRLRRRLDIVDTPPSMSQQKTFTQLGLNIDALNRPLHPWINSMIQKPYLALPDGKGQYYYWGPNYTVDPIVVYKNAVLLIQRKDTNTWALPGGFVDNDEDASAASLRELKEETGLSLPDNCKPKTIYEGPVADIRTTINAWPETTVFLYEPPAAAELPPLAAASDAINASWQPISSLHSMCLYGSHALLISLALKQLASDEASG